MAKRYFTDESLKTLVDEAKSYTNEAISNSGYVTSEHTHSQYATTSSPTLTGTPIAPTAAEGTNTTQIATTAFVQTATNNKLANYAEKSYVDNQITAVENSMPTLSASVADQCLMLTWESNATGLISFSLNFYNDLYDNVTPDEPFKQETYQAESNMTFLDWLNSDYSPSDAFRTHEGDIIESGYPDTVWLGGYYIYDININDIIISGSTYNACYW